MSNAILSGYMVGFWSYMVKYEMNEVYRLSTLYSLKINSDKYGITISFYGHEQYLMQIIETFLDRLFKYEFNGKIFTLMKTTKEN